MFADAADSMLGPVSGATASDRVAPCHEGDKDAVKKVQELDKWLKSALEHLEGVHLLPCHIKYTGPASVSELFRPRRLKSAAQDQLDGEKLEVLLHGRWLRGQEQALSCKPPQGKLQGFVVAPEETTCSLNNLRKSLTAEPLVDQLAEGACIEAEEPPATVTALRPCAEFDKLWCTSLTRHAHIASCPLMK